MIIFGQPEVSQKLLYKSSNKLGQFSRSVSIGLLVPADWAEKTRKDRIGSRHWTIPTALPARSRH
jgi:hypothetical protein